LIILGSNYEEGKIARRIKLSTEINNSVDSRLNCRSSWELLGSNFWLRTVPPFVTAHTFYASPDILQQCLFCAVYVCVEKADLTKGYQNPKRKLGVTTHFSEIIKLKFGKKLPYILVF